MVNFFAKIFIKDYKNTNNPNIQLKYITLSGIIGLALNLILFIIKLTAGLIIGSVSIFSDAFNNLSDTLTSLLAIFGSTFSRRPADKEHPFGHGRYEYIASFLVSMVIMYVGYSLFKNAYEEIRNPSKAEFGLLSISILVFSILLKLEMYKYNHDLYKRFDSVLNDGVAKDSLNDVVATSAILLCGFLNQFIDFNLDALAGLVISVLVFKTGLDFAKDTISILTGEEVSDDIKGKITDIVLNSTYIKNYHDLNVHDYGRGKILASIHAETPYDLSILTIHDEIDRVEKEVMKKLHIELVIHMDPTYSYYDEEKTKYKTELLKINSINDLKQISWPAEILKRGGLVVIPTETVYGLAALYNNENAIRKIFEVKNRPLDNPLIVHIADFSDIYDLAEDIPEKFEQIAKEFWPGPLTAVLKRKSTVPDIVTAGGDTVAIRMPDNEITRKIISLSGPLAAPSANLSGRPSPTNPKDVLMDLDGRVEMIVDGGISRVGIESTVVDFTGEFPTILRPGFYTEDDFLKYYEKFYWT